MGMQLQVHQSHNYKSLESYFPNSKNSDISNYLVVNTPTKYNIKSKFDLYCADCDRVFIAAPSKIFIGQKPCACHPHFYKTPELRMERLVTYCDLNNLIIKDQSVIIHSQKDRVEINCSICFHEWSPSYTSVVNTKRGCPVCAGQYRYTDEEYIARINDVGKEKKFTFLEKQTPDKLRIYSRVLLECGICANKWDSSLGNILSRKYSCPSCSHLGFNPSREAVLYLLKLSDSTGNTVAYKYGISNNFKRRLENIKLANPYCVEISCVWGYRFGEDALLAEKAIKKTFPRYLSKMQLPDGYTETISAESLLVFFNFQTKQYQDIGHPIWI